MTDWGSVERAAATEEDLDAGGWKEVLRLWMEKGKHS